MFAVDYIGRTMSCWLIFGMLMGLPVRAGDPINLSGATSGKTVQPKQTKVGTQFKKSIDALPEGNSLNGMVLPPTLLPLPLDPKKARERKLQMIEQKNWATINPGELQEENEEQTAMGIRFDAIEQEEESDLLWRVLHQKETAERSRAQGRPDSKNAQSASSRTDEKDRESTRSHSAFSPSSTRSDFGAHTAKELDLRELLGPSANTSRAAEKEVSLRDFLGDGLGSSREQRALHETYENARQTPTPIPLAGPGDPVNLPRDYTRSALNPIMPGLSDPGKSRAFSDPGLPSSRSGLSRLPGGALDPNAGRVSGYGSLTPSALPTRAAPRLVNPVETSKARGMNSLGGH